MGTVQLRRIVLIAPILSLFGCSHAYQIEAQVRDGVLTFVYVRTAPFEDYRVCVNNLTITTESNTANAAPPGDGMFGYQRRVWAIETPPARSNDCFADLPLAFGVVPKGAIETVPKHQLQVGVVYNVLTMGLGSSGAGSFRLRQTIEVENVRPAG